MRQQALQRQRSREALLTAAAGLFAEKPYPQVTVDDIIRSAGVSRATFYQHFTNKLAMRRIKNLFVGAGPLVESVVWVLIVAAAAWFFGWAEPRFYNTNPDAAAITWYDNMDAMLRHGSLVYALFFIVSFPVIFRLDETNSEPHWTIHRSVVEASFAAIVVMWLCDSWAWMFGPIV